MGTHNLPASYDAWRTTPPWDAPRRAYCGPSTVRNTILIETPDVQIDAWATYSADTGSLISVTINGREVPPHAIEAFVGANAIGSELDDLSDEDLDALLSAEIAEMEADRADHEYHARRDEGH